MPESVFTPTLADMESEHYGLLVSSLGWDGCDGYIAVGRDLTMRRALAAVSAYARYTDLWLVEQVRVQVGEYGFRLAITPTQFVRDVDGGWTAQPDADSPLAAAWLVPPDHPAHTA
jgi:hypothetical protein